VEPSCQTPGCRCGSPGKTPSTTEVRDRSRSSVVRMQCMHDTLVLHPSAVCVHVPTVFIITTLPCFVPLRFVQWWRCKEQLPSGVSLSSQCVSVPPKTRQTKGARRVGLTLCLSQGEASLAEPFYCWRSSRKY
jgi:hypothetical protein